MRYSATLSLLQLYLFVCLFICFCFCFVGFFFLHFLMIFCELLERDDPHCTVEDYILITKIMDSSNFTHINKVSFLT